MAPPGVAVHSQQNYNTVLSHVTGQSDYCLRSEGTWRMMGLEETGGDRQWGTRRGSYTPSPELHFPAPLSNVGKSTPKRAGIGSRLTSLWSDLWWERVWWGVRETGGRSTQLRNVQLEGNTSSVYKIRKKIPFLWAFVRSNVHEFTYVGLASDKCLKMITVI